ncbi:peptigoglycan-binding protein LysM [Aliivibrio fischeri]|uniref:LysM peptidoglycan-binding domain-containing protein n=1 Tax=Aliivibrio fischeri TaxID=668 RepID=UPI00080E3501|nr:LysM peptidoglycan-binding domain-containing protein [Aliivibrio fischeri]OCH06813.1 peptigoglycan-binding protein LysM [Aliivibrio fischeri]OCH27161.1 peptigoglycan-binding protein LysM [Aliivibrio fischeri]OCH57769.1 peptigoglycan-binding protein LysM [Aliivibrio fischeri]
MKQKKSIILVASLMSSLVLTGCASNDELIGQQKQHAEQINTLESTVSTLESRVTTLESELQAQKETDKDIYQEVNKLNTEQGKLKQQAQQQVEQADKFYTIKQDDTLYSISVEFGLTVDKLLQLNPKIENPRRLLIGQIINIK